MSTTSRSLAALVLGAMLAVPAAARAVNLTLEATKGEAGSVHVCVGLDSTGQKIAGTQNDLVWDGSCASLKANSCAAIPDSKKPLHGNTPPNLPNTYRALVFALDNVDPIRDGALYCCDFEMTANPACCNIKFDRLGVSDPVGTALPVSGQPPQLCLNTGAAVPGAAAAPAAAPPPAAKPGTPWLWIGLIAAAVVIAVLLAARKRS
ncbi:MAG TPA: hypothetical protein VL049_08980 [Candidatus Dormibacteraeota bacterium]|nr:hypothetical protein [Candidatus Dormibacteraeota bacterium]